MITKIDDNIYCGNLKFEKFPKNNPLLEINYENDEILENLENL